MTTPLTLAEFAAVERDVRAAHYPKRVASGEMAEDDAQHDWRCWLAIAAWAVEPWKQPEFPFWGLTWADLAGAAGKALAQREAALAAAPAKPSNLARRDAVAALHWRLGHVARFYERLNADLRAQAAERREKRAA